MSTSPAAVQSAQYSPGALAILSAAERLIGQCGIEGVSMRQITLAAKMANNSAVAYHFGDREGLLRAISLWREGEIASERLRVLDQAKAAGDANSPECMLQTIVRPLLVIRAEDGSHPHAAFVAQMLRSRQGREIRNLGYGQGDIVGKMIRGLCLHTPSVPRAVVEFRLRIGSLAFYDAVVERDQMVVDDPAYLTADDDSFLAELDAMLLAIVLRPKAG